jgi:hypothetical protein
VWGRREVAAFGAALAVVIVVAVGYGLARGQRVGAAPAAGRDARVERVTGSAGGPAAVTDEQRRTATERLRAMCRDLEVRLAYNGPLEARPAAGPAGGAAPSGSGPDGAGGRCDRTLTDADVLSLLRLPLPAPDGPQFADERELAEWKRDQLCGRPTPPALPGDLRDLCATPALTPDQIRALRGLYVEDPAAAERERRRREAELENLRPSGADAVT